MTRDREPLTPEERALADRLAGSVARATPSPALDARILAAARAATVGGSGGTSGHGRRMHRRWPATVGVAASLALAVGIAWQLRPLPEAVVMAPQPHVAASDAAAARSAAAPDTDPASARTAPAQQTGPALEPASRPAEASLPDSSELDPQPSTLQPEAAPLRQPRPGQEQPRGTAAAAPATERRLPPARAEAATALHAPAPPPPAPPAPPAPAAQSRADAIGGAAPVASELRTPAASAAPVRAETAVGRERIRAAPAATSSATLRALGASETAQPVQEQADLYFDQPLDEAPPATADSPQVHRAWLARIRELRDEGEHQAARESLREFHRRHPEVELPQDLAELLGQ